MPNIKLIFVFASLLVVCLSERLESVERDEFFTTLFGRSEYYTTKRIPRRLNTKLPYLPPDWTQKPYTSPLCQNECGHQQHTSPCLYNSMSQGCQATIETSSELKYVGYEYSNQTGHWYKFHPGPVISWPQAREACSKDGAALAVPNSETEAKVIMELHARYLDSEITNTDWPDWVSVGILWENGAYRTVDGQLLDQSGYARWWKGNVGTDHNYPYVVMSRGGELSTTRSVLYPYVCEKKRVRLEVLINYH